MDGFRGQGIRPPRLELYDLIYPALNDLMTFFCDLKFGKPHFI